MVNLKEKDADTISSLLRDVRSGLVEQNEDIDKKCLRLRTLYNQGSEIEKKEMENDKDLPELIGLIKLNRKLIKDHIDKVDNCLVLLMEGSVE